MNKILKLFMKKRKLSNLIKLINIFNLKFSYKNRKKS